MKPAKTLKVLRLDPKAAMPVKMTAGAAGFDLTAISCTVESFPELSKEAAEELYDADQPILLRHRLVYGTGIAVKIPKGHVGLIFPRSSIYKTDLSLSNCVGVIDSDYTGEIRFVFNMLQPCQTIYNIGDRIGQLVIMELPRIRLEEVDELPETVRGANGFGSTGR